MFESPFQVDFVATLFSVYIFLTMSLNIFFTKSLSSNCVKYSVIHQARRIHYGVDEVTHKIKSAGYHGESHKVKTDDGYLLKLHRVVSKKPLDYKGSVLMMHGLFRSSADWLASGSKIALAYYLADHGYDGKYDLEMNLYFYY